MGKGGGERDFFLCASVHDEYPLNEVDFENNINRI
jgi:hypothetical protein